MSKRRILWLLYVLSIVLIFSSCKYIAYEDYYTDISEYSNVWELSGFQHGYEGHSTFFPENVEELDVNVFFCRYDQQIPLGEGVQLFLEIQYDKETLEKEEQRLATLGKSCDELFALPEMSAYATTLGELSVDAYVSEYALVDSDSCVIRYVFLQGLPKSEIEVDHRFVPTGYTGYGEIA